MKGKWYLLISWKGFGPEYDTWEPYNEIKKDIPEMVEAFESKQSKKKIIEV